MNAIDLIVTVCAVLSPATCEERHLVFSSDFSLRQCVMAAQPYVAQSSVKNSQVVDLESGNGAPGELSLPGIGCAEGDSLQI